MYCLSTVWPLCDTDGLLGKKRHESSEMRAVKDWTAENTMTGLDGPREDDEEVNSMQVAHKRMKKASAARMPNLYLLID